MTLALGIDIGTSGVRTSVLDGDILVSSARVDHLPQDASRIDATRWWDAVKACMHRQMQALKTNGRSPADIRGIAVDGTSGSMVLTNAELEPVSPALMYNSKGFEAEATVIEKHLTGDHIVRGSNSALARAMRLVSLSGKTPKHLLHQADYVAAKLMGQGGFSDFSNALKTGFDPGSKSWPDWVDNVINPGLLPDVRAPGDVLGSISAVVAAEFEMRADTQIFAGTTDSIAAFLASAPIEEGMAVTSLGSTLAVKLLSSKRIDDPSIGLYSHRLGDLWLVGGASNTGGAVLKAYFDGTELAVLSAQIDLSVNSDLDYYPLLQPGERFPVNDPDLEPRLEPRPDDDVLFLQGMLEAMSRIEATCYQKMTERGATFPSQIFTAGGGAKNPVWHQMRASALGLAPSVPDHSEASVGVARLARVA